MNNSATTRKISSIAIDYNGADGKEFGNAELVAINNLLSNTPNDIFMEMKSVALRNPRVGYGKWAMTGYISPPKELAKQITNEELRYLALLTLKRIGVTKDNQYLLHIHNNSEIKHLHFIVNRIDTFGRCTIPARNIGKLFGEELRKVCKENGFSTDIELSNIKKNEMELALIDAVRSTRNFKELECELSESGFVVTLSQNAKDGISGLRMTKKSDINSKTQRVYKNGFKLSDISKKVNIREIKEIYRLREILSKLSFSSTLIDLQNFAINNGLKVTIKSDNDNGGIQIFILPSESKMKNGYFYDKKLGFNFKDLDTKLAISLIKNINEIPQEHFDGNFLEEAVLLDVLLEYLKPDNIPRGEEYFRKRRSIYDDLNIYY